MATDNINLPRIPNGKVGDDDLVAVSKALWNKMMIHMETMKAELRKELLFEMGKSFQAESSTTAKKLDDLAKAIDVKQIEMKAAQQDNFTEIQTILKSLPTPTVHIPKEAIRLEVEVKQGAFLLPENAIKVEVDQRPMVFPENMFEKAFASLQPPQVTLQVPENAIQQGPVHFTVPPEAIQVNVKSEPAHVVLGEKSVHVEVKAPAKKSKSVKSIIYSQATGRPEKIEEETTEE